MPDTTHKAAPLRKILGPFDGLAIVIGVVIGAGILGTPSLIAGYLGNPALILGIWVLGGISVALTALVLAELGAMIPAAGGKYAFVRAAYGPAAGCFAGWGEVLLNRSFTGAVKVALIGQYIVTLLGGGSPRVVAGIVTILFLLIHLRGVQVGRVLQNVSTVLKVALLLAIVVAGFVFGSGASWHADAIAAPKQGLLLGFALAMQSIFFTYYGAEAALQMSEEVKEPARTVPRMLLFGVGAVTLLYLLINVAFLNTLRPAELAGSSLAARDVLARGLGQAAGVAVAIAALGILFSSFNYNFLGTPRVPFGLARDGLAPRVFTRINARGTPANALYLTSTIIFITAVSGTFELLIRYMSFLTLVVDGIVLSTVIALRRRQPAAHRPFRVPLYPFVPIAAIVLYAAMLLIITVTQPKLALGGAVLLVLIAIGSWLGTRNIAERTKWTELAERVQPGV